MTTICPRLPDTPGDLEIAKSSSATLHFRLRECFAVINPELIISDANRNEQWAARNVKADRVLTACEQLYPYLRSLASDTLFYLYLPGLRNILWEYEHLFNSDDAEALIEFNDPEVIKPTVIETNADTTIIKGRLFWCDGFVFTKSEYLDHIQTLRPFLVDLSGAPVTIRLEFEKYDFYAKDRGYNLLEA